MTTIRHSNTVRAGLLFAVGAAVAALALVLSSGSQADPPSSDQPVSLFSRPQTSSDLQGLPSGDLLSNLSSGEPSVQFADARRVTTSEGDMWAAGGSEGACIAAQSRALTVPWGVVCGPSATIASTGLFMLLDAGDQPVDGSPPGQIRMFGLVPDDVVAVHVAAASGQSADLAPDESTVAWHTASPVTSITVARDDETTATIDLTEGS